MGPWGLLTYVAGQKVSPSLKCVSHMLKLGTIMPYLKKIQKIYESRDTHLSSADIIIFFTGNQQLLLYQEIQIWFAF